MQQNKPRCPYCGSMSNQLDSKFCMSCGKPLPVANLSGIDRPDPNFLHVNQNQSQYNQMPVFDPTKSQDRQSQDKQFIQKRKKSMLIGSIILISVIILAVVIIFLLPKFITNNRDIARSGSGDGNGNIFGRTSFQQTPENAFEVDHVVNPLFAEGLTPVRDKSSRKIGFADIDGDLAISCVYDSASIFNRNGTAVVTPAEDETDNKYRFKYLDPRNFPVAQSYNSNFFIDGQTILSAYPFSSTNRTTQKFRLDNRPLVDHYNFNVEQILVEKFGTEVQPTGQERNPFSLVYLGDTYVEGRWLRGGVVNIGLFDSRQNVLLSYIEDAEPSDYFDYDPLHKRLIFNKSINNNPEIGVKYFYNLSMERLYKTSEHDIYFLPPYPDLAGRYWCVNEGDGYKGIQWDERFVVDSLDGSYPQKSDANTTSYLNEKFELVEFEAQFCPLRNPGGSFTADDDILCITDGETGRYIRIDGSPLNQVVYKRSYPFSPCGLAYVVTMKDEHQYIDREGNVVIDLKENHGSMFFDDGYAIVRSPNGSEGVIDTRGEWIIPLQDEVSFIAVNAILKDEEAISENNPAYNYYKYQADIILDN